MPKANEKRLIDANALVKIAEKRCGVVNIKHIDECPTVNAVEVVHGRWIISSDGYYPYCSVCKAEPKHGEMTNYCPNCGAKMDGDGNA